MILFINIPQTYESLNFKNIFFTNGNIIEFILKDIIYYIRKEKNINYDNRGEKLLSIYENYFDKLYKDSFFYDFDKNIPKEYLNAYFINNIYNDIKKIENINGNIPLDDIKKIYNKYYRKICLDIFIKIYKLILDFFCCFLKQQKCNIKLIYNEDYEKEKGTCDFIFDCSDAYLFIELKTGFSFGKNKSLLQYSIMQNYKNSINTIKNNDFYKIKKSYSISIYITENFLDNSEPILLDINNKNKIELLHNLNKCDRGKKTTETKILYEDFIKL